MKKILLIFSLILFLFMFQKLKVESIEIPNDAIRIRVIASSNKKEDQKIKGIVKDKIQDYFIDLLSDTKNSNEAKKIIQKNIDNIESLVQKTLEDNNYNQTFNVNFGLNYFPKKVYKGVTYKEGYYNSLVITLGNGLGKNWWCVLFPPLCLLEAKENEDYTNIEYKLYIKKIINKFTH